MEKERTYDRSIQHNVWQNLTKVSKAKANAELEVTETRHNIVRAKKEVVHNLSGANRMGGPS